MLKTGKALRITELNAKISVYSSYLELYKIIECLEKGELTLEERIYLSAQILTIIGHKDEKIMSSNNLLKRAYKIIYNTIKQEIKEHLHSKVFDIVVTSDYDKLYLGEIVREEIERIKASAYANLDHLDLLIKEEIKSNISTPIDYVTFPLIAKIVKLESSEELKETIDRTLQDTFHKLNCKLSFLSMNLEEDNIKKNFLYKLSDFLDDIESYKIDIIKRGVSGVLTASLLFSVGIGGTKLLKKWLTTDYYETTKVTTLMDETVHEPVVDTYYATRIEDKYRLLLDVYKKTSSLYRDHDDYYLIDAIRETDLEYLTIDLESPGVRHKTEYNYEKYTREEIEQYSGEIRVLSRITQSETPNHTNYYKGWHITLCAILYVGLFASSFIPYLPINSIQNFIEDLNEILLTLILWFLTEESYRTLVLKLKDLLNECRKVINESDELTSIYNSVLKSGILEKDTDSLSRDINDLIRQIKAQKDTLDESHKELNEIEKRCLKLEKD